MTPPGHWPRTYRYRSFRKSVGATGRPRPRSRRPGGVIPKIAPNDPVADGGYLSGPEAGGLHLSAVPDGPGPGPGSGYSLLFDANPSAMWVHDGETLRILAANEAAVRQY